LRNAKAAFAITPSDAVVALHTIPGLPQLAQRLYVGVGGNVRVITEMGQTLTYPAATGSYLFVSVIQVLATGTTATGIIGEILGA